MSSGAAAVAAALPHYEIGAELGRGGFGIVYLGRQRQLGREVAIKQLPPAFADDAEIRDRFVTEARVLAALDHPHIVPIYDYVEQDGLCLLVMECLHGGSVWDTFRRDGLNPAHACVLVIATAAGLHHAHQNGVLHRDVKPENLLLSAGNHLKVTDFGIAKVIGGADAVATVDGGILGTPAYMAPEQADGGELGPAADVYATGTMLYELLSGRLPFSQDGGGLAIIYRHLYETPTPLTDIAPNVPAPLAEVVMRAIARDPQDRYASAEELAVAIAEGAVAGFGVNWYRESGLRVVGSDRVMSTLTDPSLGRRPRATTSVPGPDGAVPTGWGAPPTRKDPWLPPDGESEAQPTRTTPRPAPGGGPMPSGPAPGGPPSGPPSGSTPAGPTPSGSFPFRPSWEDAQPDLPVRYEPSAVPAERHPSGPLPDVRPREPIHVVGSIALDSPREALVAVRQLLDVPPKPVRLAVATGLVLLVLLVLAGVGFGGGSGHSGNVGGTVTVAGADVTHGDTPSIDYGGSVRVHVTPVPNGASAVRLAVTVDGIRIGQSDRTRLASDGTADLKLASVRFLVAGPDDATLTFLRPDGSTVGQQKFGVARSGTGFATIPGIVVVLAVLFVLAYLESLIRPLWRYGRFRVNAGIGLGLIGGLLGVVLVLLAWVLGLHQPVIALLVVCAVLGAAFGVLAGLTAARWGLNARVRRINKRAPALARV